jgi:hypothetical protein
MHPAEGRARNCPVQLAAGGTPSTLYGTAPCARCPCVCPTTASFSSCKLSAIDASSLLTGAPAMIDLRYTWLQRAPRGDKHYMHTNLHDMSRLSIKPWNDGMALQRSVTTAAARAEAENESNMSSVTIASELLSTQPSAEPRSRRTDELLNGQPQRQCPALGQRVCHQAGTSAHTQPHAAKKQNTVDEFQNVPDNVSAPLYTPWPI